VRTQVRAVATAAPYWKQRFTELGRPPGSVDSMAALGGIPAVGERDVSPNGEPAAMAGLVMHGGERQFALHSSGPQLRRALRLRVTSPSTYQRVVEAETKPTSYVWSGIGFRYPIASTRGDLDVVARAGARLWNVLGLSADDALLSAVPAATPEHSALHLAALAAGAPALLPGDSLDLVATAARLAPPTVLAAPTGAAVDVVRAVGEAEGLARVTTMLLIGAASDAERAAVRAVLSEAGVSATVLAVHAPAGARVLWAECRESAGASGLHTYPDLEAVQVVDAETGDTQEGGGSGELVVTQLGLRGSALLRWRSGDLIQQISTEPCPSCHRTVPRVVGLRRQALVVSTESRRLLDLRVVTGALAGRADIVDWRIVLGGRSRDGREQVVVHLTTSTDPGEAAVGAAADIRAVAGRLPTQLVTATSDELAAVTGAALTPRILVRR